MSVVENKIMRVRQKITEFFKALEEGKQSIRKELADSLAATDRDIHHLKQNHDLDDQDVRNIAERMRLRALQVPGLFIAR